jgi:hypothetical protein
MEAARLDMPTMRESERGRGTVALTVLAVPLVGLSRLRRRSSHLQVKWVVGMD